MKVALFGGSFDPPHIGHIAVVEALLELDYIDKVVVMPTFLNPFKNKSYADATLRLRWVKEMFSPIKKVIVSSFEVEKNEKVPTVETVKYLLKEYTQVYLVIGADTLATLKKWYKFNELNRLVTFIVSKRDGIMIPSQFISLDVNETISSSSLRQKIDITKLPPQGALEIEQYYKENHEQN